MADAVTTATTRTRSDTVRPTRTHRSGAGADAPVRRAAPSGDDHAAGARPRTTREAPTRQRRRPMLLAAGAVLVLIAALVSYVSLSSLASTDTVVVTATPVAKGDVIEATDLATIEVAAGQAPGAFRVEDSAALVGQFAAVDLPVGSLLTGESVQANLPVAAGTSIVGIAVTSAQLPATGLRAGDRIRIVSTPVAQGEPPVDAPPTVDATVFAVRPDERGGLIVDVAVPTSRAADVAARAATGRIALVLDGSGGE